MQTRCVEPGMLEKYIDNRLSHQARDRTEAHFAECDKCLERLIMLRTLLKEVDLTRFEPAPADAIQSAMGKIKAEAKAFHAWLTDLTTPSWLFSPATVRSGENSNKARSSGAALVEKTMEDLESEIYFEKTGKGRVTIWIHVFQGEKPARNVCLFFKRENGQSAARLLNRGCERFEKIPHGACALILEQDEVEKGNFLFEIDERGVYER